MCNHLQRHRPTGQRPVGTTVIELVVALALTATVLAIATPRLRLAMDHAALRAAAGDAATTFGYARRLAIARRGSVAVRIDSVRRRLILFSGPDTLLVRALGERYGVRLRGTRDSMAFDLRGLGYGAANLSLIMVRGAVAETLVVARLGRIRR